MVASHRRSMQFQDSARCASKFERERAILFDYALERRENHREHQNNSISCSL